MLRDSSNILSNVNCVVWWLRFKKKIKWQFHFE